ncbi:MAG TPA: MFS transporter [Microlunatus sp.]|jgi:MFS family permease|nr:MFS transporter [Microlunatus sp.]
MTDLAPDPATMPARTSRAALPLFVAAEAFSLFGNSAIAIVLPWLVLTRTGDPAVTGLVAAVAALPAIVAALVGGWLIDKVGQRRMSVLSDFGSAVSVAGLAVVDRVFGLDLGWFIALGILGAVFDVPGMTARETLMGRVARTSGVSLDKIASLRQAVFSLAFLGGPALAGVLLAVLDPIQVVWVTAGCSLAAGICMLILPLTAPAVVSAGAADIGGLATIRGSAALRAMLVIGFGSAVVVAPLLGVLVPAHFNRLGEPTWFGFTMSAFAAGSMIGAILYAVIASRSRRAVYVGGLLLQTLGMVGFTTLHGVWPVAIGSALVGVGGGLLSPVFIVFFTEQVAESVRGRVLGLFNALALIASPLGLGAIAVALSVTSLEVAATWLLAAWVLVMAYAFASLGMRTFAEAPVPRSDVVEAGRADH